MYVMARRENMTHAEIQFMKEMGIKHITNPPVISAPR